MSKRRFFSLVLTLFFSLSMATISGYTQAAEFDQIGTFDFPTSGSTAAQAHFILGVGYLHSFGLTQAQAEFRKAQELDPDFAMAYWGEAFTYQHPFFGQKDERPGQALMKLGATTEQRLAKAATAREKGFIRAAEAYALTPGGMTERRTAWMNAMADLYSRFPNDDEVKAFYAVSMLAGATAAGSDQDRINMRAGALALELFRKNGNHPGAAHYVIHAFDDPLHAPIALDAATKYADIAPAVSHALHMPTHIFIQHGMWDRVSRWNDTAFNAGIALWKPGNTVNDLNHSSDWGQYGDLQLGDLETSRNWIARAREVLKNNPNDARSASTVRIMQARHIIESQQWQTQPFSDDLDANELLALGLSAAKLEQLDLAHQVANKLSALSASSPNNAALKVSQMEVAALTLLAEANSQSAVDVAKRQQALSLLTDAMALTEQGRLPNGAANPLKPVHELAGEVLLETGNAEMAMQAFEQSLQRMPNRPWSLLGAARSYKKLDNIFQAAMMYEALLAVWTDDSHPAVQEAKKYLSYQ
jgi:Tfp pilus assembly protein PilF